MVPYQTLVKLSENLNVRVLFLGFRTDIPEITNSADIAVLSSTREGLGLAGIEALACGVPVVGSAVQRMIAEKKQKNSELKFLICR